MLGHSPRVGHTHSSCSLVRRSGKKEAGPSVTWDVGRDTSQSLEPGPAHRDFLIEIYGPLFGAIGRVTLPSPIRLSDFVNERDAFLRLADVQFPSDADWTALPGLSRDSECFLNKTEIEMICQPPDAILGRTQQDAEHGKTLWEAFRSVSEPARTDLRVPKDALGVQVQTNRFTISAQIHLAKGAQLGAVLSNLQTKFVAVTEARVRFNHDAALSPITRRLILVNRDHILLVALGGEQRHAA